MQRREIAAQRVAQGRTVDAQAQAVAANGGLVAAAHQAHLLGDLRAQRGQVAVAAGVVQVHLGRDPRHAGVAAAEIVGVDEATHGPTLFHFQVQVRGSRFAPGRQRGAGHDAGQVVEQQQRALQQVAPDHRAPLRLQRCAKALLGKAHGADLLQVHGADAAFDHGDFHDAVADVLFRQVGARQQVAACTVVGRQRVRGAAQVRHAQRLADKACEFRLERGGGKGSAVRDLKTADAHGHAGRLGECRWQRAVRAVLQRGAGARRPQRRRLGRIEQATRVGNLLRQAAQGR